LAAVKAKAKGKTVAARSAAKLAKTLTALETYVSGLTDLIIDYASARLDDEPFSTSPTEGAVQWLLHRRTGARQQMPEDASGLVKRLRRFTKLPVAVGFGISTPEQFASVSKFAEAAVVGSAIVQTIERNPGREAISVAEFIGRLLARST